ncbi:hypothetical protein PPTG_23595 [Phytophthora nicotianae INRA-310]|uniref:Uncharacterized protein n=1 Tax=Phytophthora nicotianae (strain INRA-310) TaxID=761204 RepID=W2PVN6_PHYN3|nr:hypothetical protein PPTG_23595 [Phytophthora nicotianae INRA-310]ETN04269.1 hypothetical protein PPTG_23595 [Phytophthora nicotianae INRA-310]
MEPFDCPCGCCEALQSRDAFAAGFAKAGADGALRVPICRESVPFGTTMVLHHH